MPLEFAERSKLRERIVRNYASSLIDTPLIVADFHIGMLAIVTRCRLPKHTRFTLAERLRDLADVLEHGDG